MVQRGSRDAAAPKSGEEWAGHYAVTGSQDARLQVKGSVAASSLPAQDVNAAAAATGEPHKHGVKRVEGTPPPSTGGAIVNVTKGIVGSGILALPNAFKGSSVVVGVVGLLITGAFSALGFLAIGQACKLTGCTSYRQAWSRAGGHPLVVDVVLFFECIIACIGYIILIGDYALVALEGLAPSIGDSLPRSAIVAVPTFFCILPLCLVTELRALSRTSAFGLLASLYSYLYVVAQGAFPGGPAMAADWELLAWRSTTFPTLTTFVSAYVAHFLAPTIWAECQEAAPEPEAAWARFRLIVISSFALVAGGYISFGLAGYLVFGSEVRSNVLTNYPAARADGSPAFWTLLCWFLMAVSLIVSYPLIFRSARDTATDVLGFSMHASGASVPVARRARSLWILVVATMVLATNAVGVVLDDLGFLLAFRGALLGCPLCFVLPGVLLLRCGHCPGYWRLRAKALIAFGIAGGCLGLYFSLAHKVSEGG